jgi:hypothetical protein
MCRYHGQCHARGHRRLHLGRRERGGDQAHHQAEAAGRAQVLRGAEQASEFPRRLFVVSEGTPHLMIHPHSHAINLFSLYRQRLLVSPSSNYDLLWLFLSYQTLPSPALSCPVLTIHCFSMCNESPIV